MITLTNVAVSNFNATFTVGCRPAGLSACIWRQCPSRSALPAQHYPANTPRRSGQSAGATCRCFTIVQAIMSSQMPATPLLQFLAHVWQQPASPSTNLPACTLSSCSRLLACSAHTQHGSASESSATVPAAATQQQATAPRLHRCGCCCARRAAKACAAATGSYAPACGCCCCCCAAGAAS